MKQQWADKYGSRWYLHRDGRPPHDDEDDYRWNGFRWVKEDYELKEDKIISLRDINKEFDEACKRMESQ